MRSPLLTTILAALASVGCQPKGDWQTTDLCMDVADDATTCPPAAQVDPDSLFSFGWCSTDIREVTGEGVVQNNPIFGDTGGGADLVCCYPAEARNADTNCAVGRPFFEADGTVLVATMRPGSGWSAPIPGEAGLDEPDWLDMARVEHASIASFARLTLELLALGAPSGLVAEVQLAAADEVEHARLCFGMLKRSGQELEPGPMPIGPVVPSADPAAVAAATVREGCLGETVGAWLALRSAAQTEDPEVAAVLTRIAQDEARHAALSWKIVGWLLKSGAPGVHEAVRVALREPFAVQAPAGMAELPELSRWVAEVQEQVLVPAAAVLLAA